MSAIPATPHDMADVLHINLLGEFRIAATRAPVTTINSPRLQSLLAYLLVHRDAPQPRQHIAFLFWPDSDEAQAQSNLRNLLLSLRRALPAFDDYVSADRRALQWRADSPYSLDVSQFERASAAIGRDGAGTLDGSYTPEYVRLLQEAVDCYPGDLLPGCYDEWIMGPRERLRQEFLSMLEKLVRALESRGDISSAILYAQRLLRHDPLREENYRRLMLLHLAAGDRAALMNTYRYCVRMLKRELDLEPSQATKDIVKQAEQLAAAPAQSPERGRTRGKAATGSLARGKLTLPGNLPAQTTPFIGRERELLAVAATLRAPDVRLVTLTGTAGTGKTRLALRAAGLLSGTESTGEEAPLFPDGVWFVALASLLEPDNVTNTIAQVLGVTESDGRTLHDNLINFLESKRLLLVLDNFEHLLPAATLVAELLAACPGLKVLVTSRAVLNLRGEHEYTVPPMSVPGADLATYPDELTQFESVVLFVERALEVSPQFRLERENARAVSEICRRLEGLPLAIELAAARTKVLSAEAILSRLDRRLKLLVGGKVDLPPRQRALETAIAWSYNLLERDEQAVFRGLSVFAGGCTLEAAERVLRRSEHEGADVLEGITSLLNKSLLVRAYPQDAEDAEPRYMMLETLKEYALEKLEESDEAETLQRSHALYYMSLAELRGTDLGSNMAREWSTRIQQELDNLRVALRWSITHGEAEIALRTSAALWRFWESRLYLSEGRAWLKEVLGLECEGLERYRALALCACGMLAVRQRDYSEAEPLLSASRALYTELGDKEGLSIVLNALGVMALDSDYGVALALHEENLALRREIGNPHAVATTLYNISFIKMHQGKWDEAAALSEEARTIWTRTGDVVGQAHALYVLGMVSAGREDYAEAKAWLGEALELFRRLPNFWMAAWTLYGLGEALYKAGEYEQANSALAEARALFTELGDKLGQSQTLVSRARERFRLCDYDEALALFHEAFELARELDNTLVIGCCMAGFAAVAGAKGRLEESALLFGTANDLLVTHESSLPRVALELNIQDVRSALGEDAWQALWTRGANTLWQDAAGLARTVM